MRSASELKDDSPLGGLTWNSVGPSNIGGRITSLALHPTDQNVIYAGAAAGGLWKSTDAGVSWTNVFNEAPPIGSTLLHPTDPNVVFVGTGEANPAGVATYPGNGLWKSTDGGTTWNQLGLEETGDIGKIAIHSGAPDRIFVAALGRYRSRTEERGIYRSTDGGTSWSRVLFINDTTGACEVVIDPSDPDRIYAATWTRYRPVTYSVISGTGSGLWISTNGGDTWSLVTNGFPNNDPSLGRISLTAYASIPTTLYALPTQVTGPWGMFKSTDSGACWTLAAGSGAFDFEGQVWYNNVVAVHPQNPAIVLAGMTDIYKSSNGGTGWCSALGSMHVDHHAIEFYPANPARVIVGNDGGVFISTNTGASWIKSYNLPVSQFYAGTIDFTNPTRYFGGTQDNGTLRTLTGSVDDWDLIYGGDGFYVLVDPTNPNRLYAESQNGGLGYSTNGGASWESGRTSGFGQNDRTNWNTPIAMDLNTPLTLYVGTYRLFKTTNGMASWTAVSSDLTRGPNGRIGTITTVDVSRSNPSVIAVGTDDGKVSITTNGGTVWTDVTGTLPVLWVTRVTIDPDFDNYVYATQSGYLSDVPGSHIHMSTDYGASWTPVGGDLPDVPVNDIIVDRENRPYLFAGTDAGVMYSSNGGTNWLVLGANLPQAPVHDLTFHEPTRTLLASTHGRSAHLIDLSTLVGRQRRRTIRSLVHSRSDRTILNPFNPKTEIAFQVGTLRHVSLRIYDMLGQEIAVLVNEKLASGSYTREWNAAGIPSGTYLYTLQAGDRVETKKMVLLK